MPKPDVSGERLPQILDAAAQVFIRKGFNAARMEDIAKQAGLSIGGVYWYFKSKEEVILALMQEIVQSDVEGLRALLDVPGTVHARLKSFLRDTTAQAQEHVALTYELYSLANRDARVRKHMRAYFTNYHAALVALIKQGIRRGEFRRVNADTVAITLAAAYEGMFELAMLDPEMVDVETNMLAALDLILRGVEQ